MPLPAPLPAAFTRLSCSNLAAQFSEQIALTAAPLAAVLLLAAGPAETGWLQTAQTLPFLLLSIPAGLLVDRTSRRGLVVAAEALRSLSLLATLLAAGLGLLDLPLLAALGALGAVGTVAATVAAPAIVPSLVPRDRLGEANRRLELARSLAFAAGPALGGAVVGWAGAPAAWIVAAILSGLAVVLLAGLPDAAIEPAAPKRLLDDLKEGAGFVLGHALLRPILITAIFFNLAWFVLQAVWVVHAIGALGLSPTGVGLTLGVYGAGMVAGAAVAPWLARRLAFGTTILLGPAGGLAAAATLLATVAVPSGLLAAAGFFLFGAGPILWTIATTTLRQAVTPDAMLGRVSAIVLTATFGARPLGAAIGALIAAEAGTPACLAVAAAGFLIQFLVILASPVPRLRALPVSARPPRREAPAPISRPDCDRGQLGREPAVRIGSIPVRRASGLDSPGPS
jgi:predicted MFS family arabinose efflux permease